MSNKTIKNKVIVITGGATGIGLEITKHFLLSYAKKAIILDINEENGKETETNLNAEFGEGKAVFIKCDVGDDFERVWKEIFENYAPIDVLVNNAGIVDEYNRKKCIDINLRAVIDWSYKFFEIARKDKGGAGGVILNVSSIVGFRSMPFFPVYQATKHGIVGFTRGLGHEENFAITGVRVIAICPGYTRTNIGSGSCDHASHIQSQEAYEAFVKNDPLQNPNVVGAASVELFEKAESGSAWVVEGGFPIKEVKFVE